MASRLLGTGVTARDNRCQRRNIAAGNRPRDNGRPTRNGSAAFSRESPVAEEKAGRWREEMKRADNEGERMVVGCAARLPRPQAVNAMSRQHEGEGAAPAMYAHAGRSAVWRRVFRHEVQPETRP